ncbi:hypothetical protein [Paenibacillus chitinolyticus]
MYKVTCLSKLGHIENEKTYDVEMETEALQEFECDFEGPEIGGKIIIERIA